jgi:hypothetical protein
VKKSIEMMWCGYVAGMGGEEEHIGLWLGKRALSRHRIGWEMGKE